jgi:hypothetical protein
LQTRAARRGGAGARSRCGCARWFTPLASPVAHVDRRGRRGGARNRRKTNVAHAPDACERSRSIECLAPHGSRCGVRWTAIAVVAAAIARRASVAASVSEWRSASGCTSIPSLAHARSYAFRSYQRAPRLEFRKATSSVLQPWLRRSRVCSTARQSGRNPGNGNRRCRKCTYLFDTRSVSRRQRWRQS